MPVSDTARRASPVSGSFVSVTLTVPPEGVNFTAGLPIVRTSPAHGTAYDITGKGVASATSLCHAIYTALDVYRNRDFYDEARENPLKKQYHEKRDDSHKLKLD